MCTRDVRSRHKILYYYFNGMVGRSVSEPAILELCLSSPSILLITLYPDADSKSYYYIIIKYNNRKIVPFIVSDGE